jgi:RNA polymerase sigma-70 factor (ECF subfamily)
VGNSSEDDRARGTAWLAAFHAGHRDVLEACYREHFQTVAHAVGQVVAGADCETVVHDVFLQLLANSELRGTFCGGALGTWLAVIARNRAVDFWRRYRREGPLEEAPADLAAPESGERIHEDVEARVLVAQFRREALPPQWASVFETRFLQGLDQREAARRIGISRTTLVYREMQVRRILHRFLRRGGGEAPK